MQGDLDKLANKALDDELSAAECAQLNLLLRSDLSGASIRRFVEINQLHYCLRRRVLPSGARSMAHATAAVHRRILSLPQESGTQESTTLERRNRVRGGDQSQRPAAGAAAGRTNTKRLLLALAAACCAALLATLNWPDHATPPRGVRVAANAPEPVDAPRNSPPSAARPPARPAAASERFAARVVAVSPDARWDSSAQPGDFLMRLTVGERLKLTRGVVKLQFATNAEAILKAPADLELVGPGTVLLRRGQLAGRSDHGEFTVQTPAARVVDVGTAFGVVVGEEDVTDVVVFEGEVHVGPSAGGERTLRLTSGMSIRVDRAGRTNSRAPAAAEPFHRDFRGQRPAALGGNEVSLVDMICGSAPGEYRSAGSIDPETGTWSVLPWSESKGVSSKTGIGQVVPVSWNPWVHSVFLPDQDSDAVAVDLQGGRVKAPAFSGGAWGSVWARRRMERRLDPLVKELDQDVEGFWGAGTTTALLDRSRWVRDGIVGLHANVGITFDLDAIRKGWKSRLRAFRGVAAHLEPSHDSQPFHPDARASFQVYVDGQARYERNAFCRRDGDQVFGVEIHDGDRLLTLLVTDGNDGPIYDRVILMDPIFELSSK